MAPGQVHSEQLETHREAEQLYAGADTTPGDGQPGERGFKTNMVVGTLGYKVLGSLLKKNGTNVYGGGGWGAALGVGAAGAGGAAMLGKLFGVSIVPVGNVNVTELTRIPGQELVKVRTQDGRTSLPVELWWRRTRRRIPAAGLRRWRTLVRAWGLSGEMRGRMAPTQMQRRPLYLKCL